MHFAEALIAVLEERAAQNAASKDFVALVNKMEQVASQALTHLSKEYVVDRDNDIMKRIHQNLNVLEKMMVVAIKSPKDLIIGTHLSYYGN